MIKEVYFTEVKWKPTHDDLGGVSGKIVFKKPVSYQDYLSISRKEYLLLDENKDKEIERLNNIINKGIEAINVYQNEKTLSVGYEDLKRIRGILQGNEFDLRMFEEYLQELKGSDKE